MTKREIKLVALDRNETGIAGCIGIDNPSGPIAGFAEIDPNGLFASPNEADALAEEMCRRWNIGNTVIGEIAFERRRQIEEEGWTPEHDDKHQGGDLAAAAGTYAINETGYEGDWTGAPPTWPWGWEWWKPKNRRRDLIRAAALIVAEIERLDRAEQAAKPKHSPLPA